MFFHGTLALNVSNISNEGLRVRMHEATFTEDFCTAMLTYSKLENHPRREQYSPQVGDGAVFVLGENDIVFRSSPTTALWVEELGIFGGITKWIGGYTTAYASKIHPLHEEYTLAFKHGGLRNDTTWKADRATSWFINSTQISEPIFNTVELTNWCMEVDSALKHGSPQNFLNQIPSKVVDTLKAMGNPQPGETLLIARCKRWIRRSALSILRDRGYSIYSADVWPAKLVPSSVLFPSKDFEMRFQSLLSLIQNLKHPLLGKASDLLLELIECRALQVEHVQQLLSELELTTNPDIGQTLCMQWTKSDVFTLS